MGRSVSRHQTVPPSNCTTATADVAVGPAEILDQIVSKWTTAPIGSYGNGLITFFFRRTHLTHWTPTPGTDRSGRLKQIRKLEIVQNLPALCLCPSYWRIMRNFWSTSDLRSKWPSSGENARTHACSEEGKRQDNSVRQYTAYIVFVVRRRPDTTPPSRADHTIDGRLMMKYLLLPVVVP